MKNASSARKLCTLGGVLFGLFSSLATAQVRDEYGESYQGESYQTVARISFLSGQVSFSRGDEPDDWQPADRNVPMTLGDRIYTGSRSRIELQVHGGDFVRLGARTDFAALNLTEDTKQFSLKSGVASIRIRRLSDSEIFEIDTPNAAVTFERPGDYRVDVDQDGFTRVEVRSGSATVAAGGGQIPLNAGEGIEVEGIDAPRYDIVELARPDAWDQWVSQRDYRRTRARSYRYVNADIVGADDLDEYGRWEQVRDYGSVWFPTAVAADWAPYRSGHWIWQDPWGWTWVSAEPWGWAPYHYGRWAMVSSRWCWVPVAPAVRYVSYSPALVAFVGGGPGWSASVSVGGGGFVGWFPLGPRDPFSPWWGDRARAGYSGAGSNVVYVNRTYVTVVNQNIFVSGGVVTGNIVRDRTVVSQVAAAPVLRGPIPVVPTRDSLHVAVRADEVAAPRPPAAIVSRMVVARTAPPPAPPTFQAKLAVISENRGAPVAPAAAARISVENRGRPQAVTDVRPVAAQPGRVTLSPREAGSGAAGRRAEPVTAFRGRPMATSEQPVSARPVTGPAAPPSGPSVREPVLRQPIAPAPPAPQPQLERGRERSVVTPPPQPPSVPPAEKVRPQNEDWRQRVRPTEAPPPAPAPPSLERRRVAPPPETPAPAPPSVERQRQQQPAEPAPGLERRREQPTAAPSPPKPNLERRRAAPPPETPVPEPPNVERQRQQRPAEPAPGLERRREQPTAAPAPPQRNLERRREPTPAPEPPQTREVRPEGRRDVAPPPQATRPQGEARQPVQRGRTVTPKPEDQKDKKDPNDKKPD
jgi:hypothetical protein